MATFRYRMEVGPMDGSRFEEVEALVDTGATYTWIPRPVLERLGITSTHRRRLQLADGTVIERDAAWVQVRIDGESGFTFCIFGDPDTEPLLGEFTLEGFGLAPDPVNQRLVPVPMLMV